jgi:hypothetical protein
VYRAGPVPPGTGRTGPVPTGFANPAADTRTSDWYIKFSSRRRKLELCFSED